MKNQRPDFTRKYAQLFAAFIALNGIVAMIFFGTVLAIEYAPAKDNEIAGWSRVEAIEYGTSKETATAERPTKFEGQSCFITLDSGITFEKGVLSCDLEVGDRVSVLSSIDGERINPNHFHGAIFSIQLYMILALALTIGGLFGFGLATWGKRESEEEQEQIVQL